MISLRGQAVRLRALEPDDVDRMLLWENDTAVWHVSGTTAPFSRDILQRFVEEQRYDIFETRQQRLVIEKLECGTTTDGASTASGVASDLAIGTIDLFEFDPFNRRAGVGILIYAAADRGKGYASEALHLMCEYARQSVGMHQLWCNITPDNAASLALFRNSGFEEAGRKRDWLWSAEGYQDELLMQKIL